MTALGKFKDATVGNIVSHVLHSVKTQTKKVLDDDTKYKKHKGVVQGKVVQ